MTFQFQNINLKQLARGLDLRAAENALPTGYSERLRNITTSSSGHISKRKGYQTYSGHLPFRVRSITKSGTKITLNLHGSVNTLALGDQPLVVYGKLGKPTATPTGDFTFTNSARHYPTFTTTVPDLVPAGPYTSTFDAHRYEAQYGTPLFSSHISTSTANNSWSWSLEDWLVPQNPAYDISILTNLPAPEHMFFFANDYEGAGGASYATTWTVPATSTVTHTILSSTHQLNSFFIVPQVFVASGTNWQACIPDNLTIDDVTGEVNITVTNSAPSSVQFKVLLVAVSGSETTLNTSPSTTTTLPLTSDFVHLAFFTQSTGSIYQYSLPDAATYNDLTEQLTVSHTTLTTKRLNIVYSDVVSNALVVEDTGSVSETYVDPSPQLTLWGGDHEIVYSANTIAGGHVTHIDSYRSTGVSELIAGLGGNLFKALSYTDAGVTYKYGNSKVGIQNRVASNVTIGPLFRPTGANTSRGFVTPAVTSDNVSTTYYAEVTAISVAVSGQVTYTFNLVNKSGSLDSTLLQNQYLTVEQAPYDLYNGTFKILAFNDTLNTITVENSNAVLVGDLDVTGISAKANVFTDKLPLSLPQEFLPNDTLVWLDSVVKKAVVLSTTTSAVLLKDITSLNTFVVGTLLAAERITDYVPVDDITQFVRGDSLQFDNLKRQPRVLSVRSPQSVNFTSITCNPSGIATVTCNRPHNLSTNDVVMITNTGTAAYNGRRTITKLNETQYTFDTGTGTSQATVNNIGQHHRSISSITVSGTVATATILAKHHLRVGDKILLLGTTQFDGVKVVTEVPNLTTFQFTVGGGTVNYTASTLNGATVAFVRSGLVVDEQLTVFDDPTEPQRVTVADRWLPIEIPTSSGNLPDQTAVQHFTFEPYDTQEIIRSTTVADNLYAVNGNDVVYKYDGTHIYQAGLPKWQAHLFTSLNTNVPALPEGPRYEWNAKDTDEQSLTLANSTAVFSVGDLVYKDTDTANIWLVTAVDVSSKLLYLTKSEGPDSFATVFTGSSGFIRKTKRYYYYFRVNAVDANNNLLSSAVTGHEDYIVDLNAACTIHHRLVGLPTFTNLDYDRLELQVFRTRANTPGDYYLVQQLSIPFNNDKQYIDIYDGLVDKSLVTNDLLGLNTTTVPPTVNGLGTELGVTWSAPPRAKYITSAGNRLVLGNIKDYSSMDVTLRKKALVSEFDAADLNGKVFKLHKNILNPTAPVDNTNRIDVVYTTATPSTITSIAHTTTTFTVSTSDPLPVVGDWVYLFHSTSGVNRDLTYCGWFQVASLGTGTFTVTFANNGPVTGMTAPNSWITATGKQLPVYLGTDYNYRYVGAQELDETDVQIRTANAVNSAMRFLSKPWLFAYAGSEYGIGHLVIRQESVFKTNFGVTIPNAVTSAEYYVNGLARSPGSDVSSVRKLFPSRVVISYQNFPEIFDNPYADQFESDSVIDINSADGQEITGVIPFFGEAVFGSGSVEDLIVVFKTNSIYLVNLQTRQISKVQSRGLGCTAPYSIAATKDGIMFANESGIYRLNRDQSVSYVGKFVERYWQDQVNKLNLSKATGHHYAIGNQYKLSIPVGATQMTNNHVLVYDHQLEGVEQEFGAWTEYTNHPVTGWANLLTDAYFASTKGRVFVVRNANEASDYRDDMSAIVSDVILRAMDFDQGGVRKMVGSVTSHLQVRTSPTTTTELNAATDLNGEFESCGTLTTVKTPTTKVVTLRSALPRRKQVYLQLQYINSGKDEEFILAGIDLYVTLLNNKGVRETQD